MTHIIIIEDDISLAQGIALGLREDGRQFTLCHSLGAARQALGGGGFDLMLLDVALPDGTGLDFCREIRGTFKGAILFITANDTEVDIVTGLELGADDYITKPFSLAVLRARVKARLRRAEPWRALLHVGDLTLDFERLSFTKGAAALELSRTEQRLLHLLVSHPGQTLPRERLLEQIWPDGGGFVDENALSVAVSRLRSKLGTDAEGSDYIRTMRGVGYCWAVRL